LSQNYNKDQNQYHKDQRARSQQNYFAHYIELQQVFATHKALSGQIGWEVGTSHRFVPDNSTALLLPLWFVDRAYWSFGLMQKRTTRILHFTGKTAHCLSQEFRKPSARLCIEQGETHTPEFPWGECLGDRKLL
jgi:hypothetical protein